MKNSKKLLLLFSLLLSGTLLFSACSKDDNSPEPDPIPEVGNGTISASIQFMDTKETVQFTGTGIGAIGTGTQDTVIMMFSGTDTPMSFWLMITPANKGNHTMGENGFECHGFFYKDSTVSGLSKGYFVGLDNIDDNNTEMDGAASFNITSQSDSNIKGSFELTMIQNSMIVENGEVIQGEIKKIKVTNGKFNVPLFQASDFDDID